jgi:ketosteroid isomerase-like protein
MHRRRSIALLVFLIAGLCGVSPAQAESPDETATRDALTKWTEDFNARNNERICDLFDPALRYDFRGAPERGFGDICNLLRRSLSDKSKSYSYALQIKEVIVSGDLAVVRLVWTLTVKAAGAPHETVSREPGLDIFRKQPDGSWKIIRYIAYEE